MAMRRESQKKFVTTMQYSIIEFKIIKLKQFEIKNHGHEIGAWTEASH